MGHLQIPTEPPTLLHQANDFSYEARRLKPGPARNELRETAKVLRELAKLEAIQWRQPPGLAAENRSLVENPGLTRAGPARSDAIIPMRKVARRAQMH